LIPFSDFEDIDERRFFLYEPFHVFHSL